MKKLGVCTTAALLGVAAMASSAFAVTTDNFSFDPDGTGGLAVIAQMHEFGYTSDNALAVGGTAAINNFVANQINGNNALSVTFNTYYQAQIANMTDINNANVTPGFVAGGTGEYTLVAGFQEAVVSVSGTPGTVGNQVQFKATGASGGGVPNFFEIYYDATPNANPLGGTGYNDGILILAGSIQADAVASTAFTITNADGAGDVVLDAHGSNDYPAIQSVKGFGSSQLTTNITFQNNDFFKDTLVQSSIFNTLNNLNFTSVDPAAAFQFTAGGSADGQLIDLNGPTTAGAGTGTTSLGTINGINGPDVQFMTRGTQDFTVVNNAVPEPITGALSLLSLGALGMLVNRRRVA